MIQAGAILVIVGVAATGVAPAPPAGSVPSRTIPAPQGVSSTGATGDTGSALREPRAAVDWRRRIVRCSGVAAPTLAEEAENVAVTRVRTERAARRAAVRACLDALRSITVVDAITAGRLMDGDPALVHEVERAIRRAPVIDAPRLFADGGVALRLAVPVDGRISELFLAAADRARGKASP